jgi:hypothetical protein
MRGRFIVLAGAASLAVSWAMSPAAASYSWSAAYANSGCVAAAAPVGGPVGLVVSGFSSGSGPKCEFSVGNATTTASISVNEKKDTNPLGFSWTFTDSGGPLSSGTACGSASGLSVDSGATTLVVTLSTNASPVGCGSNATAGTVTVSES